MKNRKINPDLNLLVEAGVMLQHDMYFDFLCLMEEDDEHEPFKMAVEYWINEDWKMWLDKSS